MLIELATATLLVLATVLIHGVGLGIIGKLLGHELEEEEREHLPAFVVPRTLLHRALSSSA